MGKGDQRSRRGKIWRGTFGKRRPKKSKHSSAAPVGAVAAEAPAVRRQKLPFDFCFGADGVGAYSNRNLLPVVDAKPKE